MFFKAFNSTEKKRKGNKIMFKILFSEDIRIALLGMDTVGIFLLSN
jgi:hypothetical protein